MRARGWGWGWGERERKCERAEFEDVGFEGSWWWWWEEEKGLT